MACRSGDRESRRMRELMMTPGEIATSYRQAMKPKEQIKILAELNAATTDEIREVLAECGVEAPPLRCIRGSSHHYWSEAEETLLRDLVAEGKTAKQVAEVLGRTTHSVIAKASCMKLPLHNYQ